MKLGQRKHWEILAVLLLSFFINVCGIWWGLPSFQGWAADEIIPAEVLAGIEQRFSNGWYSTYPPFHYYLLTLLYLPILALRSLNLVDVESLSTYAVLFFLGRLLSILMGTATVFIVYLTGREIFDRKASLFAALGTASIAPFIFYSKTVNVEVPYIFWFVLSLLFYVRILKRHKLTDYLLFSLTAVISVCTKDQAYGFYILTVAYVFIDYYLYQKKINPCFQSYQFLTDKKILLSLLVAVSSFALFQNLFYNFQGFVSHVQLLVGSRSYDAYTFLKRPENNFVEHLTLFFRCLRDVRVSLGLPLSLLCLLGLVTSPFQKQNHLLLSLLVPVFSYYLFFISVILYSRDRFLIPIAIVLTFFGGKVAAMLLNRKQIRPGALIVSLIFSYTFFYSFSINVLMIQDSRYFVEKWMRKNIDEQAQVLYLGKRKYQPRFEFQNFKDPKEGKGSSLPEDLKDKFDYIIVTSLYDTSRFKEGTGNYTALAQLNQGNMGYKLVLKYQSQPKWSFFKLEEIRPITDERYKTGNLNKINPEVKIFKRK